MIDWILSRQHRFVLLLFAYFAIHTIVRTSVSSSLSYNESEQVFLSQWIRWGYNSQPPLYTWLQAILLNTFGWNVFPIALLKNTLLLLTYIAVFDFVRRGTGNATLAVLSTLGMLTIPQVAWESQRELSHTVLVTLMTASLLYCVLRLVQTRSTLWYLLLGVVCGIGMMSKYNFAISIVSVIACSLTIPQYRSCVVDRRVLISVVLAAAIVAPHAMWILSHSDLATAKTLAELTADEPTSWIAYVGIGATELLIAVVACSAATILVFGVCFRERIVHIWRNRAAPDGALAESRVLLQFVERYLLCVTVILSILVFSGNAINIKNHWLHPFVFLLPTYLTLKLSSRVPFSPSQSNRLCLACSILACVVVFGMASKPAIDGISGNYSMLNLPYDSLTQKITNESPEPPAVIIVTNMRVAGNVKLHLPQTDVVALDVPHLQFGIWKNPVKFTTAPVVLVSESQGEQRRLANYALKISNPDPDNLSWVSHTLRFHYGRAKDGKEYYTAKTRGKSALR